MTTSRKAKTMKISQVLTGGGLLPGRVHHILTNGLLNSERQQPPTHQHQPPHPSQLSRQPKSSHVMENAPLVPVAQNFAEIGPTESPISKDDPIFWAKFKRVAGVEFFPRAAAVVAERVPGAGQLAALQYKVAHKCRKIQIRKYNTQIQNAATK